MRFAEFIKELTLLGLPPARILDYSRSNYKKEFPNHISIFNALIKCRVKSDTYEWCGDLDLTIDLPSLESFYKKHKIALTICLENNTEVYRIPKRVLGHYLKNRVEYKNGTIYLKEDS
jgi:hypothetical protein